MLDIRHQMLDIRCEMLESYEKGNTPLHPLTSIILSTSTSTKLTSITLSAGSTGKGGNLIGTKNMMLISKQIVSLTSTLLSTSTSTKLTSISLSAGSTSDGNAFRQWGFANQRICVMFRSNN